MIKSDYEHLVYFLHAEGEDYCKIGRSTVKRLSHRISEFSANKASRVTQIGHQLCENEESARTLEKKLLDGFDRVEDQELVGIDTELVKYIRENCDYKNLPYLSSLLPVPDYDDFDKQTHEQNLQQHAKAISSAAEVLRLAESAYIESKRRLDEAIATMETSKQVHAAAEGEQHRYLVSLARKLRQKHWEIKTIAEVTGLGEGRVRNVVYKYAQTKLF